MDGYMEIDFNGDRIGLKFALPANRKFVSEFRDNPELIDAQGNTTEVGIAYLIYFGYENWCIAKKERPPYKHSFEEFLDWTEDLFFDPARSGLLVEISNCYKDSKTLNRDKEAPEPIVEDVEKNEPA
jgi:hypothetical protein